jgi:oligopeptide transport system ATP-binding protein
MTTLIEVDKLSKNFAIGGGQVVHAVDEVSLAIAEKEILGLVGESGSGKSTLGKAMVGLHDKTSGQVIYRGEALPQRYTPVDFQQQAQRIQMIFQDPYSSLNPRMTVGEIIGEGIALHSGLKTSEVRARVADWLRRVGLEPDHMSRYPHEFSG